MSLPTQQQKHIEAWQASELREHKKVGCISLGSFPWPRSG